MSVFSDLFHIFYPKLCAGCNQKLTKNEFVVCTICRNDLPQTNIKDFKNNKIIDAFYGKVLIEKAYALLFYRKENVTKKLIQELKYKGNEDIGVFLGNWLGEFLKEQKEFNEIDVIVPVPLHKKRLKSRGYNQVIKFGERISFYINRPLVSDKLVRVSATKTQTLKSRFERFTNLDTKFMLYDHRFFIGKHVLLVDDVITTGATLEACAKEFSNIKACKVSVVTMAYTD
ncbi:MAG: ComF family protein [Flavobacteriaceae bacterium]|nr:ComF family protein [Flavobacteriaceae bacterium]